MPLTRVTGTGIATRNQYGSVRASRGFVPKLLLLEYALLPFT